MRYTVSYNTILRLRNFLEEHLQPTPGEAEVITVMKMGHTVSKLTLQRNFLEKMRRSGLGTKEVKNRARGNLGLKKEDKSNKGVKEETARLIGFRISAKNRELNACRKTWLEKKNQLMKKILPNWREEFSDMLRTEGNRIWEAENKRLEEKLKNLRRTTRVLPEEVEGIPVDDERLSQEYGTPAITPVILGGINASNNVKAFLSLPHKFRTYKKLERLDHQIQVEGRAARTRWTFRYKDKHPGENFEDFRRRRELEEEEREPLRENRNVDFSNLRVTQLNCNKVINMPKPRPDREEIQIESENIVLLDAFDLFAEENCNEEGIIKNSKNLTAAQCAGRKEIQQGIQEKGWMLYTTDKSGKLVLDTVENFNRAMEPHYLGEQEVTIQQVHQSEQGPGLRL